MIDFDSSESHLLLNPRMPAEERERIEKMVPALDAHVFIATSGSTGALKLVALSKRAILASAAAVNERLDVTSRDVWAASLPTFHVGGLGVYARCHLAGASALPMEWDPQTFAESGCTLASLVPAQVHDLVEKRVMPPRTLRAILVGGGAFDESAVDRARAAGWPVLPSYGMSECCSTIAIEDVLLPHLEARVESDGRLAFRGSSLLTGYVTDEGLVDPKIDGWFLSEDLGTVDGRTLRIHGRAGDFVKIGGESVDLGRLDRILFEIASDAAAIVAVPDDRLGHVIHLASTVEANEIADRFNARVHPFERIRAVHRVDAIPRSPLGKLLRAQLTSMI
ncbi:MAG: o-succinylbenzoate---CoA ligase [Thermoanaerobaculia bacterium]|jgi:O-succinylbenzoic acid--CoA ligase|nr:o-succinylbenzoate---CoA ligase [Thermoanaerobaculia bacterium]